MPGGTGAQERKGRKRSMTGERELREELCEIGRRVYARGMVAANDGNFSVRLGQHELLCTPTGVSKGDMTPEMICRIDEEGRLLEAKEGVRPSSEMKMHLRLYRERPDVGAVVHAHPPYATTFAVARMPLDRPIVSEALITLGPVPVTRYATPSTGEVPEAVAEYAKDFNAMLLANHGALTCGKDLKEAYFRMESLEYTAALTFRSLLLGKAVDLTEEEVDRIYEVFALRHARKL